MTRTRSNSRRRVPRRRAYSSQLLTTRSPQPPKRKRFHWRWVILLILISPAFFYVSSLDVKIREQLEGKRWDFPAQVYARPLEVYSGMRLAPEDLEKELEAIGYHKVNGNDNMHGIYQRRGNRFQINTRNFSFWDADEPARRVTVIMNKNKVTHVETDNNRSIALLRLEPQLIGKIYPAHKEDRIFVKLADIPKSLINALIATEDRNFYEHSGISIRGVVRASLENIRAGGWVQGGSTITQQLIKNLLLSDDRTLNRKLNEAIMALLLEWHYSKDEILEAYVNEVYLGQDGSRAIHGFGMAAWFYFNRPLNELQLAEQATLVSLVRAASYYNPRRYPERAIARRNLVIDQMLAQGMITSEEATTARDKPLVIDEIPKAPTLSPYPAFLQLVKRHIHEDYREKDLRSEGLRIFTTLDPLLQAQAEKAMISGIKDLESRGPNIKNLQGAMVVTGSENGEILALVNGRDSRFAGFNRPLNAVRQIGSLVKIAVYLSALEDNLHYSLTSLLNDREFKWQDKETGEIWAPKNYDHKVYGRVTLKNALANSYNLATVHLGMALGLERVRKTMQRLGIERKIKLYPSMLLGSLSLSPLEVAQMYQTVASGGFRVPLRSILSVLNREGKPLQRYALSVEQRFDPASIYLLNFALQEAVRHGTGKRLAKHLPANMAFAGKTGTSNDLRDSWFSGFSSDLLVVTWLGRDDNKPIYLSGGSGAMQVWSNFVHKVMPDAEAPIVPNRIRWHWVDNKSGRNSQRGYRNAIRMPFITGDSTVADNDNTRQLAQW